MRIPDEKPDGQTFGLRASNDLVLDGIIGRGYYRSRLPPRLLGLEVTVHFGPY